MTSKKTAKLTRFEMDQTKIENLESEIRALKKKLETSNQKRQTFYEISLEYKRLCEEELVNTNNLAQEISRLSHQLLLKDQQVSSKLDPFLKTSILSFPDRYKGTPFFGPLTKALSPINEAILDLPGLVLSLLSFISDHLPHHRKIQSESICSKPLYPKPILKSTSPRERVSKFLDHTKSSLFSEAFHSPLYEKPRNKDLKGETPYPYLV